MQTLTIQEIKQMIKNEEVSVQQLQQLKDDQRKGVQKLLINYEKQVEYRAKAEADFLKLKQFDQQYMLSQIDYIAGVDEAGRGPLAGPVLAASVILPKNFHLTGLNDSKQLTESKRTQFYERVTAEAICYNIAVIDHHIIDKINIYEATKKAMTEAIIGLEVKPTTVLVDAVPLTIPSINTIPIIKGDTKSLAIAAASVLAKVSRDRIMDSLHEQFPEYNFNKNKGYGTKEHLDALKEFGLTPYHRNSFAPVNQYK